MPERIWFSIHLMFLFSSAAYQPKKALARKRISPSRSRRGTEFPFYPVAGGILVFNDENLRVKRKGGVGASRFWIDDRGLFGGER
jgi:hypothetical protein